MRKYRNILILTTLQPQPILCLMMIISIRTTFGFYSIRPPRPARTARSISTSNRITFLLPDELPADYFIGNIPSQITNSQMTTHHETTMSISLVDDTGFALRFFRVSDSGDLFSTEAIDRDDPNQICGPLKCCEVMVCNITLQALFIHPNQLPVKWWIDLHLHDENDNAPKFAQPTYSVWIPEDNGLQSVSSLNDDKRVYAIPLAKDADSDPNGVVSYKLNGSPLVLQSFQLITSAQNDLLQLKVRSGSVLDYETAKERIFKLTVQAIDGGQPSRTGQMLLVVHLNDVNDNYPVFQTNNHTLILEENRIYNDPVYILSATDLDSEDNGLLRYKLALDPSGISKSHFAIHPITGHLTLLKPLDYERYEHRNFVLRIIAHDTGIPPLSSTYSLKVSVRDFNDNPPYLAVQINNTIVENSPSNQLALRLTVRDPDDVSRHKVTCDGDQKNAAYLRLHLSSDNTVLSLYTTQVVDYEEHSQLHFAVICVDTAYPKQVRIFNLTVAVHDMNDNPPVFRSESPNGEIQYKYEIKENEPIDKFLFLIVAEDKDSGQNGMIEYSLVDTGHNDTTTKSDAAYFRIEKKTGGIFLDKPLDYEEFHSLYFEVVAVDNPLEKSSGIQHTATASVYIRVLDVNDNVPRLASPSQFSIFENIPVGSTVGHVLFRDADKDGTGNVEVKGLIGEADKRTQTRELSEEDLLAVKHFKLTGGGKIMTIAPIDRELYSSFKLRILASDADSDAVKMATATVTIHIKDTNDNDPKMTYPHSGSRVIYKPHIFHHKDQIILHNTMSGDMSEETNAADFLKSAATNHALNVSQYVLSPKVVQLQADDPDDGLNGEVTFAMSEKCNGSNVFHVEQKRGIVRYRLRRVEGARNKRKLDFSDVEWSPKPDTYHMCIEMQDSGRPQKMTYSEFWLDVHVPEISKSALFLWPADDADYGAKFGHQGVDSVPDTPLDQGRFYSSVSNYPQSVDSSSSVNWSNIVIVAMFVIFALTVASALGGAICWAHSRHRRRQNLFRARGRGAVGHSSKWINEEVEQNADHDVELHEKECGTSSQSPSKPKNGNEIRMAEQNSIIANGILGMSNHSGKSVMKPHDSRVELQPDKLGNIEENLYYSKFTSYPTFGQTSPLIEINSHNMNPKDAVSSTTMGTQIAPIYSTSTGKFTQTNRTDSAVCSRERFGVSQQDNPGGIAPTWPNTIPPSVPGECPAHGRRYMLQPEQYRGPTLTDPCLIISTAAPCQTKISLIPLHIVSKSNSTEAANVLCVQSIQQHRNTE